MKIVNEPKEINSLRVIQDNNEIAEALKRGESVYHWEAGESMRPLLNHMEYCLVVPLGNDTVKRGDAVFCRLCDKDGGYYMVHQVWDVVHSSSDGKDWYKIGSTGTTFFGWSCEVLGKAYGTDIFQEVTQEIRDQWEAERILRAQEENDVVD